jgi:hypothetical protein
VTPQGAVRFIDSATRCLCDAGVPFHLKALSQATDYRRADAAVLYLPKGRLADTWEHLERIREGLAGMLSPETPSFTKVLAPGVGLAEDPGDGSSFGMHRCRLIAEALLEAHRRGLEGGTRVDLVASSLEERRVDPRKMYLNPGSIDGYNLFEQQSGVSEIVPAASMAARSSVPPLRTASEIAQSLVDSCLWHGERCNWIGINRDTEGSIFWSAMDASFYEGTSGLGLFLAEYSAETGDESAARTALGALRHALSRVDDLRGEGQAGFYSGWPGVAYAASKVGQLLNVEELCSQARETVDRCLLWDQAGPVGDLFNGQAGALFALSLMGLAEKSEPLADMILRSAGPLAGLSHGASGVGAALLEHYRLRPNQRVRRAIESHFEWERTVFDAARGNWADLRELTSIDMARLTDEHFMTSWCHGAPGIALARTRASEVLGDGPWREEALTALATTRADVARGVRLGGSASLCHSPLGNAEVLAWCRARLGMEPDPIVDELAEALRAQAAQAGFWLCDFPSATPPGLMTGLAGVGLFFLRRHNPSIASPLFPEALAVAAGQVVKKRVALTVVGVDEELKPKVGCEGGGNAVGPQTI